MSNHKQKRPDAELPGEARTVSCLFVAIPRSFSSFSSFSQRPRPHPYKPSPRKGRRVLIYGRKAFDLNLPNVCVACPGVLRLAAVIAASRRKLWEGYRLKYNKFMRRPCNCLQVRREKRAVPVSYKNNGPDASPTSYRLSENRMNATTALTVRFLGQRFITSRNVVDRF